MRKASAAMRAHHNQVDVIVLGVLDALPRRWSAEKHRGRRLHLGALRWCQQCIEMFLGFLLPRFPDSGRQVAHRLGGVSGDRIRVLEHVDEMKRRSKSRGELLCCRKRACRWSAEIRGNENAGESACHDTLPLFTSLRDEHRSCRIRDAIRLWIAARVGNMTAN